MRLWFYINYQIEIFKENGIVALENMDESSVHDLRVAMKRLYTLYDQKGIDVSSYKAELVSLRKFFKFLGKIRNLQLIVAFSKGFIDYSVFKSINEDVHVQLKEMKHLLQSEYSRDFISDISHVLKISLINQDVLQEDVIQTSLKSHYNKCQEEIKEHLAQEIVNFHNIRRLVKKQQYLLEMMDAVAVRHLNSGLLKLKRLLGKELGEWHDLKVIGNYYKDKTYISESVIDSVNKNAQLILREILQKNKEAFVKPLY